MPGKSSGGGSTENHGVDVTPRESKQSNNFRAAPSVAAPAGNGMQDFATRNKNAVNCGVLQSTANACEAEIRSGRT